MVGTLRSVETNGKACSGGVRAELFDGSDTVTLVWLGQRRIPGIDSGRTLRVRGKGIAGRHGRTGDLLVTLQVVVPTKLARGAKDALTAYAQATAGEDPRAELFTRVQGRGAAR